MIFEIQNFVEKSGGLPQCIGLQKGTDLSFFTSGTFKIHSRSQGPASPAAQLKPQDGWVCKKWKKVSTTGNGLEIVSSWGISKARRALLCPSKAAQLQPQDGWVCKKWKKVKVSTTGNGLEIVSSWGIFKACRAFALLARQHNYSLKMDGSAESE